MRVKFYYSIEERAGNLWVTSCCDTINIDRCHLFYSRYLVSSAEFMNNMNIIELELDGIRRVEEGIVEYYKTGTELFNTYVYKDRVEFKDAFQEWPDWSCTIEEYKRVMIGQKAFLMLPKESESYLEIKINDIE